MWADIVIPWCPWYGSKFYLILTNPLVLVADINNPWFPEPTGPTMVFPTSIGWFNSTQALLSGVNTTHGYIPLYDHDLTLLINRNLG